MADKVKFTSRTINDKAQTVTETTVYTSGRSISIDKPLVAPKPVPPVKPVEVKK